MRVQLLHRYDSGPELVEHLYYTIVQNADARSHVGSGTALRTADDAGLANVRRPAADFNDAVTGDQQAGVKAEDAKRRGRSGFAHEHLTVRRTAPPRVGPPFPSAESRSPARSVS